MWSGPADVVIVRNGPVTPSVTVARDAVRDEWLPCGGYADRGRTCVVLSGDPGPLLYEYIVALNGDTTRAVQVHSNGRVTVCISSSNVGAPWLWMDEVRGPDAERGAAHVAAAAHLKALRMNPPA